MSPLTVGIAALKGPLGCSTFGGKLLGVLVVLVVTVLTQLGGPFVWAANGISLRFESTSVRWIVVPFVSGTLYLLSAVYAFPVVASVVDRVPLNCYSPESVLRPQNYIYCLANRHYVTVELASVVEILEKELQAALPGRTVRFLDAGFPLGGGFPMIPHLSHGDGRRLDLMFLYRDEVGKPSDSNGSPVGYFAFVQPPGEESDICPDHLLTLRWDLEWLQPLFSKPILDTKATRTLLRLIVADPRIGKVLLEPHLKTTLGVENPKIRFQGCRAARHDDHMHIQL